MPFNGYAAAGFLTELLPLLPHDAVLSPTSKLDPTDLGKIPGKLTGQGWVGFAKWAQHTTTQAEIETWGSWNAGIGLQARAYPGLDIDIDDQEVADAIEKEAISTLGCAPCRFGRGSRRLLVYAGTGFRKRRMVYRRCVDGGTRDGDPGRRRGAEPLPGSAAGPPQLDQGLADERGGDRTDRAKVSAYAVELLGVGQQYVVEGIHPKALKPYYWRDKSSPTQRGSAGLVTITPAQVDTFYANIKLWLELNDYEIVSDTGACRQDAAGVPSVGTPSDMLAPSFQAVQEALAARPNSAEIGYDEWYETCARVKGACDGSEEGYDLFAAWTESWEGGTPGDARVRWDSTRPPYRTGWPQLSRWAQEGSGGAFSSASYDFEPVEAEDLSDMSPKGDSADDTGNMFERYVWVEGAKRAVDKETGELLDQEQFEFRIPPRVTDKGKATSAWQVFKDAPRRRTSYKNLTFRPGLGLEVKENLPDLQGVCLNIWREPVRTPPLPGEVTAQDVAPFLGLAAKVIPNAAEREHFLDYCAFTAQHQNVKINHALVLGSRYEGMGKDTLLEPLRCAIGRRYTKEIGPQHLAAQHNGWLAGVKLCIVQEMHNFERRETMNKLKPLVADPPAALPVRALYRNEFFVPNIVTLVFFTNEEDALALSKGDRRYFITWNEGEPEPRAYYDEVWDWLRAGGVEKAARWLLQRDVAAFNAKGRAPETAAKETMRKSTRRPLDAWIEDDMASGIHPFDRDLVILPDIVQAAPKGTWRYGQPPQGQAVEAVMRKAGAVTVTERLRLKSLGAHRIYALRRAAMYPPEDLEMVREQFWKQRQAAEDRTAKETREDTG